MYVYRENSEENVLSLKWANRQIIIPIPTVILTESRLSKGFHLKIAYLINSFNNENYIMPMKEMNLNFLFSAHLGKLVFFHLLLL